METKKSFWENGNKNVIKKDWKQNVIQKMSFQKEWKQPCPLKKRKM